MKSGFRKLHKNLVQIHLQDNDAKIYSKLHLLSLDFDFAQYYLGVILKKEWHHQPWEQRGTIYLQQSAFMAALVTAYARPFTASRGWPTFPAELKKFDSEEDAFHARVIELRHSVYAHSDSKNYSVRPWRSGKVSTDIVGSPALRITSEEAALLKQMINKYSSRFASGCVRSFLSKDDLVESALPGFARPDSRGRVSQRVSTTTALWSTC